MKFRAAESIHSLRLSEVSGTMAYQRVLLLKEHKYHKTLGLYKGQWLADMVYKGFNGVVFGLEAMVRGFGSIIE